MGELIKKVPKIRFKGFSGDWESSTLDDVCSHFQSGKGITADYISNNDQYAVYGGNGLRGYTSIFTHEGQFALIGRQGALCGNINLVDGKNYISEHAIAVQANENNNTKWLAHWLDKMNLGRLSESSAQAGLAVNKLLRLKIDIPCRNEQTQIGNFFQKVDQLIELQQEALDSAQDYKKAMLQKLFPQQGETVPKVRFKGFSGNWEEKLLKNIVAQGKSYSLSRNVETSEDTGIKYIHYGDIHKGTASVIQNDNGLFNIEKGEYQPLIKGDLILADASEDYQGIAYPSVLNFEPQKNIIVAGLHTIVLRPKKQDFIFLYYYFTTDLFKKHGYKVGTGMKVFGITYTNLVKFKARYPVLEEQQKIGTFFQKLDQQIEQHTDKLKNYQDLKKAMLQRLFVEN